MRAHKRTIPGIFAAMAAAVFAAMLVLASSTSTALAQGVVVDDDDDVDAAGDADDAPASGSAIEVPDKATFGVGLRLRSTFIPTGIIEAFVERAEGGHSNIGFGIEGIRRRGNLEISFGIEYESLEGRDGYWVDNDGDVDFLEYDGFGWITGDFTFVWHTELHKMVSLRYGGGAGLGVLMGDIYQTDQAGPGCPDAGVSNCQDAGVREVNEDIPPVFPVVNILAGLQIKPIDNLAINLEFGMRTVFYGGTTIAYFF